MKNRTIKEIGIVILLLIGIYLFIRFGIPPIQVGDCVGSSCTFGGDFRPQIASSIVLWATAVIVSIYTLLKVSIYYLGKNRKKI